EITVRDLVLARDDDVARAERAALFAERDVKIEGERLPGKRGRLAELLSVALVSEAVMELDRCRVRRVARPGPVVAGQELGGHLRPRPRGRGLPTHERPAG